jgi:hypothetical protein
MHLDEYLGMLHKAQTELAEAFATVAEHHKDEPDLAWVCTYLGGRARAHVDELGRFVRKYGEKSDEEVARLYEALFKGPRSGGAGLLRDLQDLYLLASLCQITWTVVSQAALGLRDRELDELAKRARADTKQATSWLLTRMKVAAPQALIVAA